MLPRRSFKVKLILSYIYTIIISFTFVAFFLSKNLESDFLRQIKPSTVLLSFFFALGLAFMVGAVLAETLTRPINRIIRVARKFSQGDFSRRVLESSEDEIGELASTLNRMAQDIEEKVRELDLQNQHLRAIFESMVESVVVVDKKSRIISFNSAAVNLFGISRENTRGRLFLEAVSNNQIGEIINNVLGSPHSLSREISLAWPVQKIIHLNASPIFDKGLVNGCVLVIHDITEIRRLETMRRDFVANVSHELKTPVTSIKGFTETLLEGALEDKENGRHFLKIIQEHSERLNSLINDLLDLSHLESKEIKLNRIDFGIRELVEEVVSGFSLQIKKKGVEIKNELPADFTLKADRDKIRQVFTNLIDNAIKFNRYNGIIRIYQERPGDKIIIEDTGCGIPVKDVPRVFERFYRVDKARSRELGGTGLGLSIVRHVMELHGSRFGVESTEGLGSKFYLDFTSS